MKLRLHYALEIAILAALYAVLGRLGQLAAIPPGHVTPIWAPSGVALAAVLLRGRRVWPGIFLGSLVVNVMASQADGIALSAALPTAAAMALGGTLEALCGAYLLSRFADARRPLSTGALVVRFVGASTLCCLVGATTGTTALSLAGFARFPGYASTWWTWWLGDLAGILVITPLFLTWSEGVAPGRHMRRLVETGAFVLALMIAGTVSFWWRYPVAYLIIPVLVWAAFRFGRQGATAAIFMLSAVAITATARGAGPFASPELTLNQSLLLLQGFMGTIVLSTVAMAALIAEREEANEALRRHGDRLEEEVAKRTAELAASEEKAQEANRAKSQFLANMSHELRTPLNAIIGYGELIEEQMKDLGQEQVLPDLHKVSGAAHHLLSVINELLDLSKIEAGKMELAIEEFALRPLVDDVVATVKPLAQKNGNVLRVEAPDDMGCMTADPMRVRQVLFNLLSNACKFTEKGSIELQLQRDGSTGNGSGVVRMKVRDSGVGLTAEQLSRLFQPFVQADASTSRRYGGTGIGLVISRRLAQMMGGDIVAESSPGVGTTMTLSLPVHGAAGTGS